MRFPWTLTGALNRRGLRSMFMQDVWPVRPIVHHPVDLNLPIGCGGVAVYPGFSQVALALAFFHTSKSRPAPDRAVMAGR